MNKTIYILQKPHWVQEALSLLLDWLRWKQVHPKEPGELWIEQPLFQKKTEAASSYIELEDYLKKVRTDALPPLQAMDAKWDRYAAVQRTQTESDEESWLHGLFVFLRAEEPEAITAEELQLAATEAVRIFAGKEPAQEESAVLSAEERISLITEMAVPDASQMQVIRFFGQLEENAEELRGITKGLISVLQTHFLPLEADYEKRVQTLRANPRPVLRWVERLANPQILEQLAGSVRVHISLTFPLGLKVYVLDQRHDGLNISIGLVFMDREEKLEGELKEAEWIQKRLRALSDPTRFEIIRLLSKKPMYVQELADALSLTPATLTHHLSILQGSLLVRVQSEGRRNYYSISVDGVRELAEGLLMLAGGKDGD